MPERFRSPGTIERLVAGICGALDVRPARMSDLVCRLQLNEGGEPVLWIDVDSSPEEQCRALLTLASVILFGPDAAPADAVWLRHLQAVR